MAQKSVTQKLESAALDALRVEGETDAQLVVRVVHSAAKSALVSAERAKEKAKVSTTARDAAEQARRDYDTALKAAENKADAAVAKTLGV